MEVTKDRLDCSICLCKLNLPYSLGPCGHMFHYECINKWFKKSKLCPYCRTKIDNNECGFKIFNNNIMYLLRNCKKIIKKYPSVKFWIEDNKRRIQYYITRLKKEQFLDLMVYICKPWNNIFYEIYMAKEDEIQYRLCVFRSHVDFISYFKLYKYLSDTTPQIITLDEICKKYFDNNIKMFIPRSEYKCVSLFTTVELENDIELYLVEFCIYNSENWEEYISNSPVNISRWHESLLIKLDNNISITC